jgi:hypothetical protein
MRLSNYDNVVVSLVRTTNPLRVIGDRQAPGFMEDPNKGLRDNGR